MEGRYKPYEDHLGNYGEVAEVVVADWLARIGTQSGSSKTSSAQTSHVKWVAGSLLLRSSVAWKRDGKTEQSLFHLAP